MWEQLLRLELFHFLFVFARLGSAFLFMPFFSSAYITKKIRLMFTLAFAAAITPLMARHMPIPPDNVLLLFKYLIMEITIGLFLGLFPAFLMTAIDLVGTNAAMATSFSNAVVMDPQTKVQSTVLTSFLTLVAVMLIVVTNLHHLMVGAILDSYANFPVGKPLLMGDFSEVLARILSAAFNYGFRIGAPFLLMIILLYSMMGVMSRLMPQLNIIFVAMPAQVYLGLALLMVALPMMMMWFLKFFDDQIGQLLR